MKYGDEKKFIENNKVFTVVNLQHEITMSNDTENIKPKFCSVCIEEKSLLLKCSNCGEYVCGEHFNLTRKVCAFCDGYFVQDSTIKNQD